MEMQLQELIEHIKKEGVAAAEEQAAAILQAAQIKADVMIASAKVETEEILRNAEAENQRMMQTGNDALRQAGRNLLISFRASVVKELDAVVQERVASLYASEVFPELMMRVLEAWAKNPEAESLSLLVSNDDLQALEGILLGALREKMLQGVTLRPNDRIDAGFRVAVKDGSVHYDYSAEAVTEMLSAYLSPKVTALLKEAEGV